MEDKRSRNERRLARQAGELDHNAFMKVADKFIDVANKENKSVKADELHMAFLFAAARYNAYVANAIMNVDNHEEFVKHMVEQYTEMLRQHLADDQISRPA
jgi:hypothetical protein